MYQPSPLGMTSRRRTARTPPWSGVPTPPGPWLGRGALCPRAAKGQQSLAPLPLSLFLLPPPLPTTVSLNTLLVGSRWARLVLGVRTPLGRRHALGVLGPVRGSELTLLPKEAERGLRSGLSGEDAACCLILFFGAKRFSERCKKKLATKKVISFL